MYFHVQYVVIFSSVTGADKFRQLVLGEIAMKPNMVFAKSALSQLKAAYNLFARVTDTGKTKEILVSTRIPASER
jgi:hypothetical protein